MPTNARWISPLGSQWELTRITGIPFSILPTTKILESVAKPTKEQHDILRYLHLHDAVKYEIQMPGKRPSGQMHTGGKVWIDKVVPYAMQVCKDDLSEELPRNLGAAKPVLESITRQNWELNPASLTTRMPASIPANGDRGAKMVSLLSRLEENKLVQLDFRDNDIVAVYGVSRKLGERMLPHFRPKPFQPAKPGTIYDLTMLQKVDPSMIGPLKIFPGGLMTQQWRTWKAGP